MQRLQQGRVAAPCPSPRSHPLGLKSSPSDAESNFPTPDLDPGWVGSRGSARLPHGLGKQQGLGCPASSWPGTGTLGSFPMEKQFLIGSCALDLETSPLCFRYHFICFSAPGWGRGNSPFFNLWAFSIADQALPRQKLHPRSGCLLCRLHSPSLSHLGESHPCSPFFWWHQGLCHQSPPVLVALGCCGAETTLSHLIKRPGMNVSDAACDPAP